MRAQGTRRRPGAGAVGWAAVAIGVAAVGSLGGADEARALYRELFTNVVAVSPPAPMFALQCMLMTPLSGKR